MPNELVIYVNRDINELYHASEYIAGVLSNMKPLKGTSAHGLPQTLASAKSKVSSVINALEDYQAKLLQDGDAVPGQNVNTYV